jgi:hypothetical protein
MKHKGFDNRNIYNSTIHKQWLIMLSIQSSLNIQAENNLNVTTLFTNPQCVHNLLFPFGIGQVSAQVFTLLSDYSFCNLNSAEYINGIIEVQQYPPPSLI